MVISTIYNQICVHIRFCAAFCCSEEKREEADGGNSNWKLYKDGVVSSGSWDNAGSVTIDCWDHVLNGLVGNGLVDANLGGVIDSSIHIPDNLSAAEHGVLSGAYAVISRAWETSCIESHILCGWDSNNEGEGEEDGSGFHIEILFAVN